jgi:porphobilinogen deaminase
VKLKIIQTQGDAVQDLSLDKLEGKGFFTKEIEDALLNNETDIAVHSHKDLPTESPKGLVIGAVSEREDPSEILIIRKKAFDPKKKLSISKNASVRHIIGKKKVATACIPVRLKNPRHTRKCSDASKKAGGRTIRCNIDCVGRS